MKVVLTKRFPSMLEAQEWWKGNREDIKVAVGRVPR